MYLVKVNNELFVYQTVTVLLIDIVTNTDTFEQIYEEVKFGIGQTKFVPVSIETLRSRIGGK